MTVVITPLAAPVTIRMTAPVPWQVTAAPSGVPSAQTVAVVPTPGPPGPVGPPGNEPYVHVQLAASTEWIINHNRNAWLGATVFSVGGAAVEAEVLAVSVNQVRIYFAAPFAGTARLS